VDNLSSYDRLCLIRVDFVTYITDWVQKTYGENQQVHIIYEDLPNNDFNSLIGVVEGWRFWICACMIKNHMDTESYK